MTVELVMDTREERERELDRGGKGFVIGDEEMQVSQHGAMR